MFKSIVWRLLGVVLLATVTWIYTRDWFAVGIITFIHHASFLVIFYLHERVWQKNTHKFKPIFKALTYEVILGNLVLGSITLAVTGSWLAVSSITLTYIPIKLVIYPIYDLLWKSRRVVYAYVVADILHIGHLIHLEKSKKAGDYLIVGVLSDEATEEKKPRPIIPAGERATMILALKFVDKVVPQRTYSPLENIQTIKPDVLMESTSHKEQPANEFVESYGGEVIVSPYFEGQSSTSIKNKIIKRSHPPQRLKKKERDQNQKPT